MGGEALNSKICEFTYLSEDVSLVPLITDAVQNCVALVDLLGVI